MNSGELELIAVMVRVHAPVLQRVSGLSAMASTQVCPKLPELAIMSARRGDGAKPETETKAGLAGSLLKMVMVPAAGPVLLGWNLMGSRIEVPGLTTSGKDKTPGTRKSPDEEEMPEIKSGHGPVSLIVSSSSRREPT